MPKQLELMLQDVPLRWDTHGIFSSGKRNLPLEYICSVVAAMHHRGVMHGELTPRYVDENNVYVSEHTGMARTKGDVFYYFYATRSEEFDIFCLGILALLQQGAAISCYEKKGFPEHYYDKESFVGIQELDSYWRQCLHRDPSKRPSIRDAPYVKHILLYPLPVLPVNACFTNDFLLSFAAKGYLHFEVARKYPVEIIARISEEEFRTNVCRIAENVTEDRSLQRAVLHHETLPLYHMLRDAALFCEGLHLLAKRERLSHVSDAVLLEFFCSYVYTLS